MGLEPPKNRHRWQGCKEVLKMGNNVKKKGGHKTIKREKLLWVENINI